MMTRYQISKAFDALFKPEKPTPYRVLNDRLSLTYAKKDRFLVLNKISNLGTVIRERIKAAKTTSPPIFVEALGAILSAA